MDKHFELHITGEKHLSSGSATGVYSCGYTGCRECLKRSITLLMVHDAEFRGLINEAGRAANEIRAEQRKGNSGINPQNK